MLTASTSPGRTVGIYNSLSSLGLMSPTSSLIEKRFQYSKNSYVAILLNQTVKIALVGWSEVSLCMFMKEAKPSVIGDPELLKRPIN